MNSKKFSLSVKPCEKNGEADKFASQSDLKVATEVVESLWVDNNSDENCREYDGESQKTLVSSLQTPDIKKSSSVISGVQRQNENLIDKEITPLASTAIFE